MVDDESTTADLVVSVLEDGGFHAVPAYGGQEALERFAEQVFDAVITDIRMEAMGGFELMRRIQSLDGSTKVIVMTAYDSYDMVLRALQSGAYDYLNKPLDDHQRIVQAAGRACEYSKLVRENESLLEDLQQSHTKLSVANRRLVDLNTALKKLANTDSLTQLYNRRYCEHVLDKEVRRHSRYGTSLTVAMFDVDHFKSFNDTHGHEMGDEVLKHVANILLGSARQTDTVARYGGEEFMVVLPDTDMQNSMAFADRARQEIHDFPIRIDNEVHQITVSVGLAGAQPGDNSISTRALINSADSALYDAKNAGRNTSSMYTGDVLKPTATVEAHLGQGVGEHSQSERNQADEDKDGSEESDSEAA